MTVINSMTASDTVAMMVVPGLFAIASAALPAWPAPVLPDAKLSS